MQRLRCFQQRLEQMPSQAQLQKWKASGVVGADLRGFQGRGGYSRAFEEQLVQARPEGERGGTGILSAWCQGEFAWQSSLQPAEQAAQNPPLPCLLPGPAVHQHELIWMRAANGRWMLLEALLDTGNDCE